MTKQKRSVTTSILKSAFIFFVFLFICLQSFLVPSAYSVDFSCPGGQWVNVGYCGITYCLPQDDQFTPETVIIGENKYEGHFCGSSPCNYLTTICSSPAPVCEGNCTYPGPFTVCTDVTGQHPVYWCKVLAGVAYYKWQCPSVCTDGQTQACPYTGPAGTENVGICMAGTQTCVNGQWGTCIGEVLPQPETCGDLIDNNCNGPVDEGCDKILSYVSGNGQEDYICKTLQNPFVVSVSGASQDSAGINWQITNTPPGAAGASIANQVTETTGSDITSSAYLKLGNLPGSYTTEASCGECTSGSPQIFTATAKCPEVPVYYQGGTSPWADDPYDNWCKILNADNKVIGKGTCKYDEKGNLIKNYAYYTIADKGCALTSMAMVMRIYGSQASPAVWNEFLTVSGGYTSGSIRWKVPDYIGLVSLDLSRKSKDDITPLDNSLMETYLDKCIPAIVKIKNWKQTTDGTWYWNFHWVVVTKKASNSYTINDPGYTDRISLSDHKYNNEIYAIQAYKRNGGCQ